MKRVIGLALFFASVVFSAAQNKPRVFTLGMSEAAVHANFGFPASYFADGEHYKYPPRFIRGSLWEVFPRRAGKQIYEARLDYDIDPNSSRLHPSLRVSAVRFVFDRPLPARLALKIIPEVSQACSTGCSVFGYNEFSKEHLLLEQEHAAKRLPVFELSWVAANEIDENAVASLDDLVTTIDMYLPLDDGSVPGEDRSGRLAAWPE